MPTNIVLDAQLVAEAMRYGDVKTKRELVDLALRELVAARRREAIAKLIGNIQIDPAYDRRPMRRTLERER
jgi:Arc/MetJ family transcription regulator